MIKIRGLTKRFKEVVAIDRLNFEIEEGDVFGYIGPNGAGKTTTIRILATLLKPDEGWAEINGYNILTQPYKVRGVIGYMPDFFGLYDDMKVWEYLDFFAAAYKIERPKRKKIIEDVLELTDLEGKREDFVEELSRGMKQRLCLAKTLLHDPQVLLLDEPAAGLDPRARIEFREIIKELQKMGKTILISSHILTELSDFCNTIGIIEKGELLCYGKVDQIVEKIKGSKVITVRVEGEPGRAQEILLQTPGVVNVASDGNELEIRIPVEQSDTSFVLNALLQNGIKILSFSVNEPDLEDIFMKITKGTVQ